MILDEFAKGFVIGSTVTSLVGLLAIYCLLRIRKEESFIPVDLAYTRVFLLQIINDLERSKGIKVARDVLKSYSTPKKLQRELGLDKFGDYLEHWDYAGSGSGSTNIALRMAEVSLARLTELEEQTKKKVESE